jgi:hypothetical protein
MDKKSWILKNCRFAQQQAFDFYNPAEYTPAKPLHETQDQQFWKFVKTECNPTKMDPIKALNEVNDWHPDYVQPFVQAFRNIYQPRTAEFPTGIRIETVKVNNNIFVVESGRIREASEWIHRLSDMELYDYIPERDFNKEFWDGVGDGFVLYHATPNENLKTIMKKGLNAENRTRGLSNRGMGSAVFTSPEPTSIDSYGDSILEIDVGAMKAAGYMPTVSQEEPFQEEGMKSSIAHELGIDEWIGGEYGSEGLAEDTIAFYGSIPAKFLSIYSQPNTV